MQREKTGEGLTEVAADYDRWKGPFKKQGGVAGPIVADIEGKRNTALFLTLTTALNRQRDAEALYTKFGRLWEEEPWIFQPDSVIEQHSFQDLANLFEEEGVRFGETDAKVWYDISRTLYEDYNSNPMVLFEQFEYDIDRIGTHVKKASGKTRFHDHGKRFPVLRGEKIRPLWLRLISRYVHPLTNQEVAEISVDTHIIQITNKLFDTEYTTDPGDKETIRKLWRDICEGHPIDPIDIDGPLWFIDRSWDEWGKEYLLGKLSDQLTEQYDQSPSLNADANQDEIDRGAVETNEENKAGHSRSEETNSVEHAVFVPHDGLLKRSAKKVGTARYFVDVAELDLSIKMTNAPYHLCDGRTLAISPEELHQSSWTQWTIHQFRLILMAETLKPDGWRVLPAADISTDQYFHLEQVHFPALIEARDEFSEAGLNETLHKAGHHPDQFVVETTNSKSVEVEQPSVEEHSIPDESESNI
jgi:hypothetical protein